MKKLRETEATLSKLTGETIKVLEKSGVAIKQLLIRSNAFQGPCSKPIAAKALKKFLVPKITLHIC